MQVNDKPFMTFDFGLASYLVMKGARLLGSVRTDTSDRLALIFIDNDELHRYEDEWQSHYGEAVRAKDFNKATRVVRDALKKPVKGR